MKRYYRRVEVVEMLSLDEGFLERLLQETAIFGQASGRFTPEEVERIRIARHLEEDLDVNPAGVEAILFLRERMLAERRELISVIESLRRRLAGEVGPALGQREE